MQDTTVMAFRKRLSKNRYKEIHITKLKTKINHYKVSAVEPLGGKRITHIYSINGMHLSFR